MVSIIKFKILTAVLIITLVIGCEKRSEPTPESTPESTLENNNITASSLYYLLDDVKIEDGILEHINLPNYDNFKKDCVINGSNSQFYTYTGRDKGLIQEFTASNRRDNMDCDAIYADMKNIAIFFLKDEFDRAVNIATNNQNQNEWLYQIHKYPEFAKATAVLYTKYNDLAERELTLRNKKDELLKTYGNDFSTTNIDNDIKHLNNLAWKLREPTKRFFPIAKKYMMKIDEAHTLTEAMHGLKTFTQEIEIAGNQPSEALEKSVADIEIAINNLEKELNK